MTSIFKAYKTNKELEAKGVWIDFAPNDDKTIPSFCVRRTGGANTEYNSAFERARRPFMDKIATDSLSNEEGHKVLVDAFVDAALVGWTNFQDEQGTSIAYTPEAAKKYFMDMPDFFHVLNVKASALNTFQDKLMEQAAKNL